MSSSQPGQAKSFLFYCAVLLVTGSSVVFGLDWATAPLPPMRETEASVQAAKLAAHVPPPLVRTVKVVTPPSAVKSAQQAARGPQVAAVNPAAKPARNGTAPVIMTPEQIATQPPPESEQPKCDIDACAAAYRSFRESDCSWQPYEGPRRFCDKGTPPQDVAAVDPNAETDAGEQVSDKCDIAACKQAYFTFTPSDCTYQPSNGPRRLCTRGTPPKQQAAADAATAAANATNKADAAKTEQAKPDQANPKCDIEACKQAYFTFTPSDCTYQPSNGPRRLCTKGNPSQQPAQGPIDPAVAAANAANAAAKAEQEKQDKARQEQAKLEQLKQEQLRQEQLKQEQLKQEQLKQEQLKQEQLKQEQAKQEQAKQEQVKQEQAKPDQVTVDAATADQATPKCDIEACKQAYFTFTTSDCTYQPSDGPRRLCTKGRPPKPEAKVEPAAAPPNADAAPADEQAKQEQAAPATATAPSAAPVVSDKCDVDACKRAYFTFNPADCTYQPSDGSRRLCTKGTPKNPQAAAPTAAPAPKRIAPNHIVPPALVPAGR